MATKDEMADFDSVITNFMKEQGIPGASLCVAKGGHIIYTQSMFIKKVFSLRYFKNVLN